MTVKCEAMAEAASMLQATESNQGVVVDDSSAKTIEFLRARLLSERAASKAARQQAQQIAEKVKDLHARLEMEIEHRKEAEAAMGKVFTILKAKGLASHGLTLASADLTQDQLERGVSPLNNVRDASCEKDISCPIVDSFIDKEVPLKPLENKDESTEKGMVETQKHVTNESHTSIVENGISSVTADTVETCRNTRDAVPCSGCDHDVPTIDQTERGRTIMQTERGRDFSSQNTAKDHHCQVDDTRVQHTVINKPVVHADYDSHNCSPKNSQTANTIDEGYLKSKKDTETAHTNNQGESITLKLKAMLHQIEEEVGALPKEQPLKYQLQGWVDRVASVLDKGEEAGLNGGFETQNSLDDRIEAGTTNHPLKGATVLDIKAVEHTKMPILLTKKENADTGLLSVNQIYCIPEEVDTKEELDKSLPIVPENKLQRNHLPPASNNYNGEYPSTMYPPTGVDPVLHTHMSGIRRPSHDSSNGSYRAAYVLQDPPKMPLHQQMMQCGISQTSMPMFANRHTSNSHYIGSESSYLVEVQSSRSSDVLSLGEAAGRVGYAHGHWNEAWSQGRSNRQSGYREDALKFQYEGWSEARGVSGSEKEVGLKYREMISSPYFLNNATDELYMKQDRHFNHGNIQHEGGPAISHATSMHLRHAREFNMKNTARHPKFCPLSDAALSLMDDKNGRLGDILVALDAARQHVNDDEHSLYAEEQLIAPPTPAVAEAPLLRGYRQYRDEVQQAPYEYRNHTWKSRARSQTPIIHFPPSPTSEQGYSPFARHGGHRRSSSVATNFMMSEWESCLQPRGEVQLGNGITLYTD